MSVKSAKYQGVAPRQRDRHTQWQGGLLRCRLCRRLAGVVLFSILAVEAIILVPSYWHFEEAKRAEYISVAVNTFIAARAVSAVNGDELRGVDAILGTGRVTGITIRDKEDALLLQAGRRLDPKMEQELIQSGQKWIRESPEQMYVLFMPDARIANLTILGIDTTGLGRELRQYIFRIAGLTAIVAGVVTGAAMLVLRQLLLKRLGEIGAALSSASEKIEEAGTFIVPDARDDELGQLSRDVNALLLAISSTLNALHEREREIVILNDTLENKIEQRTLALEQSKRLAEAASRAKSSFLANVSHELKTPLNAIIGFAEVMNGGIFGPIGDVRYRESVAEILSSGKRLSKVVDDVLELAKIDAGDVRLNEEEIELSEVAIGAIGVLADEASVKSVRVEFENPKSGAFIRGDNRRLRQVCVNLLSNAIKFTEPDTLVSVRIVKTEDGRVGISIVDCGPGISAEDITKATEPFGQVADVMIKGHQGIGLGLPLAKKLLKLHQGSLEFKSDPTGGTVVTAWLPVARILKM